MTFMSEAISPLWSRDSCTSTGHEKSSDHSDEDIPSNERDIATHVITVDDDLTLTPWTFRSFILGLVLSPFGGVLGQLLFPVFETSLLTVLNLTAQVYYFKPVRSATNLPSFSPHSIPYSKQLMSHWCSSPSSPMSWVCSWRHLFLAADSYATWTP